MGLGCAAVLACVVGPAPEDETGGNSSTGVADSGASSDVLTTGGAGGTGAQTGMDMGDATDASDATGTDDTSGTSASSTGPGGPTGGDTCNFLCSSTGEDTEVAVTPCDVFAQDCPEGEKCSAYAEGGGSSWNATKCVPVGGDGQPGEPCMAQGGGVSGLDDCAKGIMCWDVDEMNQGTCVALCTGNESDPMCADGFFCPIFGDGVLNICLPTCDPLAQDCQGDDLCLPHNDTFICALDASGVEGQVFDPCEFANVCDAGLLCVHPSAADECDPNAGGCCIPFCNVSDPDVVCPGVGQACVSFYEPGMAPPEFAKVGTCMLPL